MTSNKVEYDAKFILADFPAVMVIFETVVFVQKHTNKCHLSRVVN